MIFKICFINTKHTVRIIGTANMFSDNQLSEVRSMYGFGDGGVDIHQSVDLLEQWVKKQDHFVVKDYSREYLERYIILNKGSLERCKKRLDALCTFRGLMPEFFTGIDPEIEYAGVNKHCCFVILPRPTPDHRRVVVGRVFKSDEAELYDMFKFYRYSIAIAESFFQDDYLLGLDIVMDIRSMSLALMSRINPVQLSKALTIHTKGYGVRIRSFHFVSQSKLLDSLVKILKQVMSAKLAGRIHIHEDYESLYKHIPKRILPEDLGGEEKSMEELSQKTMKFLSSNEQRANIRRMERASTDESRRSAAAFNEDYCGAPGSFRKLCIE